jgi:hypothetical protein
MLIDPSRTPSPLLAGRHRTRRRGVIAALALLALGLLVGCGGGGADDSKPSTGARAPSSQTSSTTAPTQPQRDKAAEQKIVDAAQLRLSDFPSGWQQSDDESDSEDSPCGGIRDAKKTTTAHGSAPDFSTNDSTQATNTIYLYADEGAAHIAFSRLTDRDTRVCIGKELGKNFEKQSKSKGPGQSDSAEVGTPSTGELSIKPLGDERAAGRVTLPVSAQGQNVDVILDLIFVRAGRGMAIMIFVDVLSPFDEDLRADLTGKVVRRLTADVS